mmetsp:Transcript_34630/g.44626  ORF Transcript_34630/g.44626 Transcript_34630/m.44626 type:complete len:190 (+) Transcript_34630:76-645(+)
MNIICGDICSKALESADETFDEEWEVLSDTFSVLSIDSFMLDNADRGLAPGPSAQTTIDGQNTPTVVNKNAPEQTNESVPQKSPSINIGSSNFRGKLAHDCRGGQNGHTMRRDYKKQYMDKQQRRRQKHAEKNHGQESCKITPINCVAGDATRDKYILYTGEGRLDEDTIDLLLWMDEDFNPQIPDKKY